MKPGIVVREKRLIPVTTKPKKTKLDAILGGVQRSTLRDEILVCAMVSPDGKTGVFLDDTGREYLIKEKELDEKLTYISANYVKKQVDRYTKAKKSISQYESLVKDFITKSDTPKRYQDWVAPDGFEDSEVEIDGNGEVNEENLDEEAKYQKGKTYISKDGKWKFKVLGVKGGEIQILDLSTNLKCKVELSDLELMNPRINEDDTTSAAVPAKKETITEDVSEETLDESASSYRGYDFKWRTEHGEKNFTVSKDKKELGTFGEDEYDDVIKSINRGKFEKEICEETLDEAYNPFKDLKRLPDSTNMRPGLYTDGEGGVYEAPKSGKSKKIKLKGHTFEYDYGKKKIFIDGEVFDYGLSISSWLDNPEYWCEVALGKLNEEGLDESVETVKVKRSELNKINKIAAKYSKLMEPKEFTKIYDELEALGVEVDLITGMGYRSPSVGESWTVGWKLNGKQVENSKFVYQVYKPESGSKYEYNVYFS